MARKEVQLFGKNLLLAEFYPWYANAFMLLNHVVTVGHVADATSHFSVPGSDESGYFTFKRVSGHDIGVSAQAIPGMGFTDVQSVSPKDAVIVSGHHGTERTYFEIEAVVYAVLEDGKIVLARVSGKKFQKGMSGSPALLDSDTVVGALSEGFDLDDFVEGDAAIFEPAQLLLNLL